MYYYGLKWIYGKGIGISNGIKESTPCVIVYRFKSKEERQQWLERGNPYTNKNNYREAVLASNPIVKKYNRKSI